jgi:hypothetical protein
MALRIVFYSWQTDSNATFNRYFIEDCLKRAITKLNREELSDLVIDRDTKNVPGMPDIGQIIMEKIAKSAVVVADLSIINPAPIRRPDERPVSNPNVLFELGYAFGKRGPKAMIGVFNTASGEIDELPFDLRPKRLLSYQLASSDDKARIRTKLVDDLAVAIKQCLGDTEQEQIDRNSRIHRVLIEIMLFGSEIDEWYGIENLPKVIQNHLTATKGLPELMTQSACTPATLNIAGNLIRKLQSAATPVLNEENWPTVKQIISSAGELAGMLLGLLGYEIDKGSHDQALNSVVAMPSKLDNHIESLQNAQLRKTDLEELAHDLRMTAFLSLLPQHPGFAAGLKEISLDFRRLVLRWAKNNPGKDEAISAVRNIRDRLSQLATKYGDSRSDRRDEPKAVDPA